MGQEELADRATLLDDEEISRLLARLPLVPGLGKPMDRVQRLIPRTSSTTIIVASRLRSSTVGFTRIRTARGPSINTSEAGPIRSLANSCRTRCQAVTTPSPSSFDAPMKTMFTAPTRPRISSGVRVWISV